ncbi:MAG: hypothetical protein AB1512_17130 [Thermodesulfobacteriota bacterium]
MARPICVDMVAPIPTCMEIHNRGFGFPAGSLGLDRRYRESRTGDDPEDWQEAGDSETYKIPSIVAGSPVDPAPSVRGKADDDLFAPLSNDPAVCAASPFPAGSALP